MAALRRWAWPAGLTLLALVAIPFALYAARFGLRGFSADLSAETYLIEAGAYGTNAALLSHMIAGGVITALVPLQLIGPLRRRWQRLHRWTGRLLVALAVPTAIGGLAFIAWRGTIGGPWMDAGFAAYGLTLLGCAAMTWRSAWQRHPSHRDWALRFFVLAMGSLAFRLHYVLWYLATDGLGSNDALTGPFDRIQVWAFWLPYLLMLELWLRARAPHAELQRA